MDPGTRKIIEALHRAPYQCVLAVTGGGTKALGLLLNVPGGSRTVLEAVVPYHEQALTEYLGARPESHCSAATACEMARRGYERAQWLARGTDVVGLGCTASLATDRPKKGDHRFHVAVRTPDGLTTCSLTLQKGARDREGEEGVLDTVLFNGLAAAFGIAERLEVPLLPGEVVQSESPALAGPLEAFLRGELAVVCVEADGRILADVPPPKALLAGAFHPVHEGHWGLAAAASRLLGFPVAFELSVTNVDKPPLGAAEVRRRSGQFCWRAPLWLTRAPTFVQKAQLFPGVVFVVGADTAARIVAAHYYRESEAQMAAALEQIRALGCRFLVAGRVEAAGRFVMLQDLEIPEPYRDLFTGISEANCRFDVCSTWLRERTS